MKYLSYAQIIEKQNEIAPFEFYENLEKLFAVLCGGKITWHCYSDPKNNIPWHKYMILSELFHLLISIDKFNIHIYPQKYDFISNFCKKQISYGILTTIIHRISILLSSNQNIHSFCFDGRAQLKNFGWEIAFANKIGISSFDFFSYHHFGLGVISYKGKKIDCNCMELTHNFPEFVDEFANKKLKEAAEAGIISQNFEPLKIRTYE